MVTLGEVAQAWINLGYGNATQGNTPKNNMEYFLSCTSKFNRQYHIHLLTYENGKAKLKPSESDNVLMENIYLETNADDVATRLYRLAGYNTNIYCPKNFELKYLKYKKKYLDLKNKQ